MVAMVDFVWLWEDLDGYVWVISRAGRQLSGFKREEFTLGCLEGDFRMAEGVLDGEGVHILEGHWRAEVSACNKILELPTKKCKQYARHFQDDWKDFLLWSSRCGSWAITMLCALCVHGT